MGSSQVKLLDLKHVSGKIQGYPDDMGKKILDLRGSVSCLYRHTHNCQLFLPLLSTPALSPFNRLGSWTMLCLLSCLQLLGEAVLRLHYLSFLTQCLVFLPHTKYLSMRDWIKQGLFFLYRTGCT